jgi:hypothetical protein
MTTDSHPMRPKNLIIVNNLEKKIQLFCLQLFEAHLPS